MVIDTKIKICGVTRLEDVLMINKYPVDYIGFIFAESKRRLTMRQAQLLTKKVRKGIKKVGVFVNAPKEDIELIADVCSLDIIQLHGVEDPSFCADLRREVWKTFSIKDKRSFERIESYKDVEGILLDTYVKGKRGGSGQSFDWYMAKDIYRNHFTVLAGGLNSKNVNEAINIVNPHVVDVSSSVEIDGSKNEGKIRDFIRKVKGYES
ncbi:phosphoribosylanthranilate isomerase [Vallitalea okinawensis]|uniref:phosphoribosylanthranilate isomerase n=1 Tax=Vallitalea okinawensis TaxID=2078660 RepID=UPI000CFD5BA5|nr:phosphoribosylanthranilate isomerase [Vallitalea okinawensis]